MAAFRVQILIAVLALVLTAASAKHTSADELYQSQTIVTGQGEANRLIGFGACLEDVLIEVSGAQQLAGDVRLDAYKPDARNYVREFAYHDQKSGKPKGDEQATRDRSYDLIVDFEPAKIDALLRSLGLKPWLGHRPILTAVIEMQQAARNAIITTDGEQTKFQRESLFAAAKRRGMSIVLPSAETLRQTGITEGLPATSMQRLAALGAEQGREATLAATFVWDDQELAWATEWRLDWHGHEHRWRLRAVTFDDGFRLGIGGAAQILSGNGDPS